MTQNRRIQTARVSIRQTGAGQTSPRPTTSPPDGAGAPIPSRPDDTALAPAPAARPAPGPPDADAAAAPTPEEAMRLEGVYIISVAARILDMHPQTLRKYERLALVRPSRTDGMLRLYSTEDIRKLRLIRHLSEELGMNLAGIKFALDTLQNLHIFRQRLAAKLNAQPGQSAEAVIDAELAQLLQRLNLPVDP